MPKRTRKSKNVKHPRTSRDDASDLASSSSGASSEISSAVSSIAPVMIGATLTVLLVVVHYGLWLGHNSVTDYVGLKHDISALQLHIDELSERNGLLKTEVIGLKSGFAAVEARARNDLGLVRDGETFYQIID